MALIKCTECGKEINEEARTCPNCGAKLKTNINNILKQWWFWLIIVLTIISVVLIIIFKNSNKNESVGTAGISKEEFEEIQVGKTTNFELNRIIDKNDEWNNDDVYDKCVEEVSKSKDNKKYTYVYKYYGEKGGYAIITLQTDYSNGQIYNSVVVINKENHGLK